MRASARANTHTRRPQKCECMSCFMRMNDGWFYYYYFAMLLDCSLDDAFHFGHSNCEMKETPSLGCPAHSSGNSEHTTLTRYAIRFTMRKLHFDFERRPIRCSLERTFAVVHAHVRVFVCLPQPHSSETIIIYYYTRIQWPKISWNALKWQTNAHTQSPADGPTAHWMWNERRLPDGKQTKVVWRAYTRTQTHAESYSAPVCR